VGHLVGRAAEQLIDDRVRGAEPGELVEVERAGLRDGGIDEALRRGPDGELAAGRVPDGDDPRGVDGQRLDRGGDVVERKWPAAAVAEPRATRSRAMPPSSSRPYRARQNPPWMSTATWSPSP
jgi:hypothetical protein